MKNITANEMKGLIENILYEYVAYDCLADDCNDFCGQITADELTNISMDAINEAKSNDKFLATLGFSPDFIKKCDFDRNLVGNISEHLACEAGVHIL